MAMVAPFISLGLAVVGTVSQMQAARGQDAAAGGLARSAEEQQAAADRSREIAELNASIRERESREEERRLRYTARKRRGEALALLGGSGATSRGAMAHFDEMDQVLAEEVDWLRSGTRTQIDSIRLSADAEQRAGYSQAEVTRQQARAGRARADSTRSAAWTTLFEGGLGFGRNQGWIP